MTTLIAPHIPQCIREWQSYAIGNCGSPSSRTVSVRKIEHEFFPKAADRRVLDVGGTKRGFIKRASIENRSRITIVNPADSTATYRYLKEVPETLKFDLIMMFGVLNELKPDYDLRAHFRDVRDRLAPKGVFLVAEPDFKKIKEKDCLRTLLEVGFTAEKIQKRIDLRPGLSLTKYFIFSARI